MSKPLGGWGRWGPSATANSIYGGFLLTEEGPKIRKLLVTPGGTVPLPTTEKKKGSKRETVDVWQRHVKGGSWKCEKSWDTGAHHWIEDKYQPGYFRCKYCSAERRFNRFHVS